MAGNDSSAALTPDTGWHFSISSKPMTIWRGQACEQFLELLVIEQLVQQVQAVPLFVVVLTLLDLLYVAGIWVWD